MKVQPVNKTEKSAWREPSREEKAENMRRIANTYPEDHKQKALILKCADKILGKNIDISA